MNASDRWQRKERWQKRLIKAGPLPAFLKWESTLLLTGKITKEAEQNLPVSFLAARKCVPCVLLLVSFDF